MHHLFLREGVRKSSLNSSYSSFINSFIYYKTGKDSLYFGHFLKVVYDDDYENGTLWIKVWKLK